jgi:Mrp family chromosome partitioning ATPase
LKGKVAGGEVAWTLARAHLLLGQPEPARRYLKEVIAVDARLRGRAGALLLRISEVEAE